MTEWFEHWFGEEYLRLYPNRDDTDAEHLVSLIEQHVTLGGRRVLDLACGSGRHTIQFAARGASVVGFDLSMPLLSVAHHRDSRHRLHLVRGDMRRLPFAPGIFDLVVNLFTSFGYFADDRQHETVIVDAAAALRRGGSFILDYLNADQVRDGLIQHEESWMGRRRVTIERRLTDDGRFVIKEMHMVDDGRSFLERVRLFTHDELRALLRGAGLHLTHEYGDYDCGDLTSSSPRAIFIAERT